MGGVLAVDLGNSEIKFGIVESGSLRGVVYLSTPRVRSLTTGQDLLGVAPGLEALPPHAGHGASSSRRVPPAISLDDILRRLRERFTELARRSPRKRTHSPLGFRCSRPDLIRAAQ